MIRVGIYTKVYIYTLNMPRVLMNKVDIMQEKTGNVSRETEILKKNKVCNRILCSYKNE